MNKAWHRAHPMPARATRAQRLAWHEAHARACGCRPIPASLQGQLGIPRPRRRLRYGVAISLDGFIAGTKGEFDWIVIDPAIDFGAMYREFDTAVMGRKTHEVMKAMGGHGALPGIDDTVVFSRTLRPAAYPRVRITREDPRRVVQELKAKPGKDIWLYGGGKLFRYLLDAGLVDTVEVAVIPVILGAGIPLLQPGDKTKLVLADFKRLPTSGTVFLSYSIPGGVGPAPRIKCIRPRAGGGQEDREETLMFTLEEVVPWGRSFDEYRLMFVLRDADLARRILGCGDGPASFNAEATSRGSTVVSVDPIYQCTAAQVQQRIEATYETVLEQTRRNAPEFVWDAIGSVEELGRVRMAAMRAFLEDYPEGQSQGRYVDAALPALPFADRSFDLALCSHLLFLYSVQLDEAFHVAAALELCRVAAEVRVFPLLALGGQPSPHVEPVASMLRARGHHVSTEAVPYEFQRGGNQMLRVRTTV